MLLSVLRLDSVHSSYDRNSGEDRLKFKEAKVDSAGCKSYKICPVLNARCCIFCEEQCETKCDYAKIYPKQTKSWQANTNCPYLVSIEELAWEVLLGPNVPKLRD